MSDAQYAGYACSLAATLAGIGLAFGVGVLLIALGLCGGAVTYLWSDEGDG